MTKFRHIIVSCLFLLVGTAQGKGEKELRHYLFDTTETYSAYLVQNDKVLFNEHRQGFHENSKHLFWSCTKSVMATLVGMAIQEGRLKWEQSVCSLVPELSAKKSSLCKVTLEHLMFWQSGIDWGETYEKGVFFSDVIEMLFGSGHRDMGAFLLGKKLAREPGSSVDYSSGDSVLVSYLLRRAYPEEEYRHLVENRIVKKLGLKNFLVEKDTAGTYVASSYLYSSVVDLARYGELYLKGGRWHNEQLLSPEFIAKVTHRNPKYQYPHTFRGDGLVEGGQWWINQPETGQGLPWSNWPADTFAAQGHWGQMLVIVPSKNLIFVRAGNNREKERFDGNKVGAFLKEMGIL